MSDVLKLVKKVFTVGVVAATIMWSVGASVLTTEVVNAATSSCPTLDTYDVVRYKDSNGNAKPDQLVKGSDGKFRLVIWGWTIKTWNNDMSADPTDSSFSEPSYLDSVLLSNDCYKSVVVPNLDNSSPFYMSPRPGTALVREATDKKYFLTDAFTPKELTDDAAKAIYGDNYKWFNATNAYWPYFASNEQSGKITKSDLPKVKNLLVYDEANSKYYLVTDSSGNAKEVTSAGMTANRLHPDYAYVADSADMNELTVSSSKVSAKDAGLVKLTEGTEGSSGSGESSESTGGTLSASLSANTPSGSLVPDNAAYVDVLKFDLKNDSSSAVSVNSLKVQKTGYASDNAINGLLVYDESGSQHGNTVTSLTASATADLLFSSNPIKVSANDTETVAVKVHTASGYTSGDFKLSVTSVTGPDNVSGLPITSNSFTMTDGSNSLSTVEIEETTDNNTTVNLDTTVDAMKFKLSETTSNENVKLHKLTLYNDGTAADADFKDVKLVDQAGDTLATAQPKDRYVTFDLTSSPKKIDKGTSENFTVKTTIVDGASRYVRFVVQEQEDIMLKGVNTGSYVLASIASVSSDDTWAFGDHTTSYNKLTINEGTLSVTESNTPSSNLAAGESDAVLGKFVLKPNGEDMQLRKMRVAYSQGGTVALNGTIFVKVDGTTVYSASASSFTTSSSFASDDDLGNAITMSTYATLKNGEESVVTIVGSVSDSATTAESYGAAIDVTEVKKVNTNKVTDPSTSYSAATARSVSAADLDITNINWHAGTNNIIQGETQAKMAKFTMNASNSGEDIRVNNLKFSDTTGASSTLSDLTNLRIYEEGKSGYLETTNSTAVISSTSTITFTLSSPLIVKKSEGVRTFYLKADVSSGAAGNAANTHKFAVKATASDIVGNDTAATGVEDVLGTAQTITISSSGSLNVSVDYGSGGTYSENSTVTIGSTQEAFTVFSFKATDEDIKVTDLTLTATGTLKYTDFQNIKLYKDGESTAFATAAQFSGAEAADKTYTFTDSDKLFEVKAGETVKVRVKADISGEGGATLGNTLRFQISDVDSDITAKGNSTLAAGNKNGTPTLSYHKQIVPTGGVVVSEVSPSEGSSLTRTVQAGSTLGQFKVYNSGSSAITLATTTLYDGGTNSTSSLVYELYESAANGTSPSGSAVATTTKSSSALEFDGSSITIEAGQYKTLSVKVGSTGATDLASGDTFQLYVSSIGDVLYDVTEANLLYDGNADGDSSDTINDLYTIGKPALGTYVKQ